MFKGEEKKFNVINILRKVYLIRILSRRKYSRNNSISMNVMETQILNISTNKTLSSENLDITCCKFSKTSCQVYSISYNKREMRMPFNSIYEEIINLI